MANEVHVGDVGTVFRVQVVEGSTPLNSVATIVDISTASVLEMWFLKPTGVRLGPLAGALTTDGTDGKLQYTSLAGDIDEDGVWRIQVRIGWASGATWGAEVGAFSVYKNIFP